MASSKKKRVSIAVEETMGSAEVLSKLPKDELYQDPYEYDVKDETCATGVGISDLPREEKARFMEDLWALPGLMQERRARNSVKEQQSGIEDPSDSQRKIRQDPEARFVHYDPKIASVIKEFGLVSNPLVLFSLDSDKSDLSLSSAYLDIESEFSTLASSDSCLLLSQLPQWLQLAHTSKDTTRNYYTGAKDTLLLLCVRLDDSKLGAIEHFYVPPIDDATSKAWIVGITTTKSSKP
jgi:hypothetical protein